MIIKENLELMSGVSDKIPNILDVNKNTLKGFEVSDENGEFIKMQAKIYGKGRRDHRYPIIEKNIDKFVICFIDKYPLPGSMSRDGYPVLNLSVLPERDISDFKPADIYSIFVYSYYLTSFFKNKPFRKEIAEQIINYYFLLFMSMFGKRHGLVGSYKYLIPKLRFLIYLYVYVGMFGMNQDEKLYRTITSDMLQTPVNYNEMNLDDDFSSPVGFFNSIRKNGIMRISENVFINGIIKRTGNVYSLPAFEDVSRFFSTLTSSTIVGNLIFSSFWKKIETKGSIYNKLLHLSDQHVKKGI